MLNQIKTILERMNQEDPNVIALNQLLDSVRGQKNLYMLRYKGKYLTFHVDTTQDPYSNGTIYYLGTDDSYPIWTTEDLHTALYNKYVNTEYYCSDYEKTTRDEKLNPEEIEIVDIYGNVYWKNRKLISLWTMRKVHNYIYRNCPEYQLPMTEDLKQMYGSPYDQRTTLKEAKAKIQMLKELGTEPLDVLYLRRKEIVQRKIDLVRNNKSTVLIHRELDEINDMIKILGGK